MSNNEEEINKLSKEMASLTMEEKGGKSKSAVRERKNDIVGFVYLDKLKISVEELREETGGFEKVILVDSRGQNGSGDRVFGAAGKKLAFSSFYFDKTQPKHYGLGEIDLDKAKFQEVEQRVNKYREENKQRKQGTLGYFIWGLRKEVCPSRPIDQRIYNHFAGVPCQICGLTSELVVDHKNYFYDDGRVLDKKTQRVDDFQSLCNKCNLIKRTFAVKEVKAKKFLNVAEHIPQFEAFKGEMEQMRVDKVDAAYFYDPKAFLYKVKERIEKNTVESMLEVLQSMYGEEEFLKLKQKLMERQELGKM